MLEILCLLVFVICYLYIGLYYLIKVKDIINYFISRGPPRMEDGGKKGGAVLLRCCCLLLWIDVDKRSGRTTEGEEEIFIIYFIRKKKKKKEVRSAEEEGECVYVCMCVCCMWCLRDNKALFSILSRMHKKEFEFDCRLVSYFF